MEMPVNQLRVGDEFRLSIDRTQYRVEHIEAAPWGGVLVTARCFFKNTNYQVVRVYTLRPDTVVRRQ